MKIFSFWEKVKWYNIKVFNEREIRAGAGIMFTLAIIAFMNSWLLWNFFYTKVFVVVFLIDFAIRLFVNPKFAPSLILARLIVWNQKPEYVWAPQKRFAWLIWFILGFIILYTLILNNIIGPFNMIICVLCLILFWFESIFWICIWCKMYNLFTKNKSELCAWWVCENNKKEKIQKTSFVQVIVLVIFLVWYIFALNHFSKNTIKEEKNINSQKIFKIEQKDNKDCVVPDWAKAIWHEELWKKHHGCK